MQSENKPRITVEIMPDEDKTWRYDIGSATDIGARAMQQDCAIADVIRLTEADAAVGVLCDGMGGMDLGEVASEMCMTRVYGDICEIQDNADLQSLVETVCGVCDEMADIRTDDGEVPSMGTTLTAVRLYRGSMHYLSIGDSRIYRLHAGRITQLTTDLNYGLTLRKMVNDGLITADDADIHPQKEALTSFVGARHPQEVDVSGEAIPLSAGDAVLLCSDGLYRALSDEELAETLQSGADAQTTASTLIEKALAKNLPHQDNVTALVIFANTAEAAEELRLSSWHYY